MVRHRGGNRCVSGVKSWARRRRRSASQHAPHCRGRPSRNSDSLARWPHGRPTAETHRRRHRGRQGDARQSRHRCNSNRATARRLSGHALSLHPGRANREYARRLTMAALPQRPDAPGGFSAWRGPRLSADCRRYSMPAERRRCVARRHSMIQNWKVRALGCATFA